QLADLAGESQSGGSLAHPSSHGRALGRNAVVGVGDDEFQTMDIVSTEQEIQQRHRVEAARDSHYGSARRQSQTAEVPPELLYQSHATYAPCSCAVPSKTSRTFLPSAAASNGFCRNGDPGIRSPRRITSSSVYPEM